MGAQFNSLTFTGTKEQIIVKWNNAVLEAGHNNGHGGYTGSIVEMGEGIDFRTHTIFDTINAAENYISENHSKWDGPIAVQFKTGKETEASKKKQNALFDKKVELSNKAEQILKLGYLNLKNGKSLTLSCKKCKSKLNKEYIRDHVCPLCNESLLSLTIHKRYDKVIEKFEAAKKECENYIPKVTDEQIVWLVGGWCSC